MRVRASTLRGRGIEYVGAGAKVTRDTLSLSRWGSRQRVEIDRMTASIDVDELRTIFEFLRSMGIEMDFKGDMRRQKQAIREAIKSMVKRGWLNDQGLAATEAVWGEPTPKPAAA